MFENIRPEFVTYANHAKNADSASDRLAAHPDLPAVWARYAVKVEENSGKTRGVMLDLAREILDLPGMTLTREEGKDLTADQKRLEATKKWLDRNLPKDEDDAPKAYRLAITGSGDGGPTGTIVITADDPLFAVLVGRLEEPSGE